MKGENMRYLLLIFFLFVMIINAGCVSNNQNLVTLPETTMQTPENTTTSPSLSTITPAMQTFSPIPVLSTYGNSKPVQIQCGVNKCPPNWFCCNNVCYDPDDGNTGFCCGNTICPKTWECRETKYENTCFEGVYRCVELYPRYVYSQQTYLSNPEAVPCLAFGRISESFIPYNVTDKSKYCQEKFPNSVYSSREKNCLKILGYVVPPNAEYDYCLNHFENCNYDGTTNTCSCRDYNVNLWDL